MPSLGDDRSRLRTLEREVAALREELRRAWQIARPRDTRLGRHLAVLSEDLPIDGEADAEIWAFDGTATTATGKTITVHSWGTSAADGEKIFVAHHEDNQFYHAAGAGGLLLRLGILNGDLNYRRRANVNLYKPVDGTSSITSYVSTGETVSAGDWMLNPGEVLEGGTHVVIANFPAVTGSSWIVIAAACAADPNGIPSASLFAEALSRVSAPFVPPPPPSPAVSHPPIVY